MSEDNPDAPPETTEPEPGPDAEESPGNVQEGPGSKPAEPSVQPRMGDCVPESPSGEDLPPEESNKIIQLTLDILQLCQKKVDDQKIGSHSLSFMLLRIKETLDAYYNDYIPKLNTFLYHADRITGDYYGNMCNALPQYGDYIKAIKDADGDSIDVGFAAPVHKQDLLELVQNVTDNYHAAAMFLKTGRTVYKDINSNQPERVDMVTKTVKHIPDWLKLQDNVTKGLEDIREQAFKISAYVDFLKQGESKIAPTLDLSALNQSSTSGDTSQFYIPNKTMNQTAPD